MLPFIDEITVEQVWSSSAKLGQDLRAARQARRWPQRDTAKRAGMSLATYKRLEAGDAAVGLRFWLQAWGTMGLLAQMVDGSSPHRDETGERSRRRWANVRVRRVPRREEEWDD